MVKVDLDQVTVTGDSDSPRLIFFGVRTGHHATRGSPKGGPVGPTLNTVDLVHSPE
jgi:hypothetical protein